MSFSSNKTAPTNIDLTSSQNLENKSFDDEIPLKEIAEPSAPAAGYKAIYVDSADGKLKTKNNAGDVEEVGVGGSSSDSQIKLYRAFVDGTDDFTKISIDDILPDFGGSDTLTASFTVPTTGSEAILSNDDDHAVYRFSSTTNSQYDAVGFSSGVPRGFRGRDLVLQLEYRTADTSGDSADADYMVYVFDETNGVNTTTSTTGSQTAGSTITVGTTTGMSVGDKIFVGQTGGTDQVTEAHITEIPSGTTLKISEDVNLTSGDRFITGILTDTLTTLDAADSDTDKEANQFKVVFLPPANCANVTVMFQQLTSQTDSFLFVDNILISSEVTKRVFGKRPPEYFKAYQQSNFWDATGASVDSFNESLLVPAIADSKYVRIDNVGGRDRIVAKEKIKLDITGLGFCTNAGDVLSLLDSDDQLVMRHYSAGVNSGCNVGAEIVLEAEDYVYFQFTTAGVRDGALSISAEPIGNDVVVVESTDSSDYLVRGEGNGGGSVTADVTAIDFTEVEDTKSIWDGSTLIPTVTGDYSITGCIGATSSHTGTMQLFEEGTLYKLLATNSVSASIKTFSGTVRLTAGNSYDFRASLGFTLSNTTHSHWIQVHKIKDADDYQPLLAFPTITYGQDAEQFLYTYSTTAYVSASDKIYLTSATGYTTNTINNLGTMDNDSTNGLRFTATKRCKFYTSLTAAHATAGAKRTYITLNDSAATFTNSKVLMTTISNETYNGGETNISACVILEPGDYINYRLDSSTVDSLSHVTILVEPEEGQQNQAAIIAQPVAFVKETQNDNVASSTSLSAGSFSTNALNTLKGDIAAVEVTLSSNQFTLPAGKYKIKTKSPLSWNSSNSSVFYAKARLRNTTDGVTVDATNGIHHRRSGTTAGGAGSGLMECTSVITITKSTTFEVQTKVNDTANWSSTIGPVVGQGETEEYTEVEITRMK